MTEKSTEALPSFLDFENYGNKRDHYFTDKGYETIQDFFLSWTFRCSEGKYRGINEVNDLVNEYARRAIFGLIFGINNEKGKYVLEKQMPDSFIIEEVKVFRQWKNIDLRVDVHVQNGSESKKYILNIENKFYSNLRDGQLKKYSQAVNEYFQNEDCEIINLFIGFDTIKEGVREICSQNDYKYLTCWDIEKIMNIEKETGNDIFDEFWMHF